MSAARIDKDHVTEEPCRSRAGIIVNDCGRYDPNDLKDPVSFRAYDADSTLLYEGRCSPGNGGLALALSYVQADAGATYLTTLTPEGWQQWP